MFRNFDEIKNYLLERGARARLVLAGAHDDAALEAVVHAHSEGLIDAVLMGRESEILSLLERFGESAADYEIIDCEDGRLAAQRAVRMVREGEAQLVMKGLMPTADYMRAVLDKENGLLPAGALLSQATVLQWLAKNRLMVVSDCAVNIAPSLEDKIRIIENSAGLAKQLGIETPKVAVLSALELVNPKIPSSVDAKVLSEREWTGCIVEGPYALDNAISPEAAAHKGITGKVAGEADVLIMPDLCSGNIMTKTLTYFGGLETAGALCGTDKPVVMTSRTDSPANKLASIHIAMLGLVKDKG